MRAPASQTRAQRHKSDPKLFVDRLEHPVRRRLRRPRTEQSLLPAIRLDVRHAIATVGEHHRHVTQQAARVVRRAPLARRGQRVRERVCEPGAVGSSTSSAASACDTDPSPSAVASTGSQASRRVHPTGYPPGSSVEASAMPILTDREDVTRCPAQPLSADRRLIVATLHEGDSIAPRRKGDVSDRQRDTPTFSPAPGRRQRGKDNYTETDTISLK